MLAQGPKPILEFITGNKLTFIIPVYQRNYSWSKENCEQLFEDVINSTTEEGAIKAFHYFGNIVFDVQQQDLFSGYKSYVLIDGQQRITSTALFLAAIRDEETNEQLRKSN